MLRSLKSSQIAALTLVLGSLFGTATVECGTVSIKTPPTIEAMPLDYDQTQYRCIEGQWQTVEASFEKPYV